MNKEPITIKVNNKTYNINLEKALQLGLLTEPTRPLTVADLKNGDVFMFISDTDNSVVNVLFIYKNKRYFRLASEDSKFPQKISNREPSQVGFFSTTKIAVLNNDCNFVSTTTNPIKNK